ncbi:hypothetical protein [Roseomonas haemaphysalidis]|jgi:hypothetical protein|uniref:Uncharacterized protein n=1 Tax=Roseomonas haemaphysalidis TaxID=2768162 RepID=A0ABS3KWH2_9PROT|nr:hypothetical protein [Roseomonas haemaphysalidis]MBO1081820.1 hypothetical protein [Roseomonas haemaphysalidis]
MPALADRNTFTVSDEAGTDPQWTVTAAVLQRVHQRLKQAGGTLPVWAIMDEDTYETFFGDGFYLHLRAIAWSANDAEQMLQQMPSEHMTSWHLRSYTLGVHNDRPALLHPWPKSEEFYLAQLLRLVAETA